MDADVMELTELYAALAGQVSRRLETLITVPPNYGSFRDAGGGSGGRIRTGGLMPPSGHFAARQPRAQQHQNIEARTSTGLLLFAWGADAERTKALLDQGSRFDSTERWASDTVAGQRNHLLALLLAQVLFMVLVLIFRDSYTDAVLAAPVWLLAVWTGAGVCLYGALYWVSRRVIGRLHV